MIKTVVSLFVASASLHSASCFSLQEKLTEGRHLTNAPSCKRIIDYNLHLEMG